MLFTYHCKLILPQTREGKLTSDKTACVVNMVGNQESCSPEFQSEWLAHMIPTQSEVQEVGLEMD